jgi:hypothetical protein
MNKKLNPAQILSKAGNKYLQLKISKGIAPDLIEPEIKSDQVKAAIQVLCEEINKILEDK